MIDRRTVLGCLAAALAPAPLAARPFAPDEGGPGRVAESLPDMSDPRPSVPRVIDLQAMGLEPGRRGGELRTLIGGQKDIRLMTLYGYARLVGYDRNLVLQPDILLAAETDDDRRFTLRLRPGHRWSDGSPFTAEDFRYCWDDVLQDPDLRPGRLPDDLLAEDAPPRFEVLDDLAVRFTWDAPNPRFLPRLAAPQPLVIAMPAAYLKQFHAKYQDTIRLSALIAEQRVENWVDLHAKMSRSYRPENPDLPMLDPWVNTTPPPANQFVFVRNSYFHRVDENGVQLPYVDKVVMNVSSPGIIPAKAGAGETDLQAMGLAFDDYRYLKEAEKLHPVRVGLWKRTQGSAIALLPNLTCKDDGWRALFRNRDVRRALSLAIDRHEINMVSFFGLAREGGDTVLPESPLFKSDYAAAWSTHDPAAASVLLDGAGLDRRDGDGIRLLPDGRRAEIIVESAGESTLETDVLELITDHWLAVGIKLFTRVSQRDLFRSRAMAGDAMMSVWGGIDNGVPTADMSPAALAPTADDQLQWPLWGMHYLTQGKKGQEPDLPPVRELLDLFRQWSRSATSAERTAIWQRMLAIRADEVFSIGTVNGTLQPVLHSAHLRNVPDKALFGFDPTSYLGVYMPDTFWLREEA
ncbi:MAG: ABC transporter substrate-binding protein [Paracoccaceae bacterium]